MCKFVAVQLLEVSLQGAFFSDEAILKDRHDPSGLAMTLDDAFPDAELLRKFLHPDSGLNLLFRYVSFKMILSTLGRIHAAYY